MNHWDRGMYRLVLVWILALGNPFIFGWWMVLALLRQKETARFEFTQSCLLFNNYR
jgi:hypothetical protein